MNLEQSIKLALTLAFVGGIALGAGTAIGGLKYQERIQKEKARLEKSYTPNSMNYYLKKN